MNWQTKCARRVKRNFSGVKHFLEGVKKHLGELAPLTPRKSAHVSKNLVEINQCYDG